jgi:eukaryotic-like serine/threonine-protein kinase
MADELEEFAGQHGWSQALSLEVQALVARTFELDDQSTLPPSLDEDGVAEQPWISGPRDLAPPVARALGRYEDLGLLGTGGMGEVRRVRDAELSRTMAMKILRSDMLGSPASVARFVEEAQCSAQLQHPGIVPVHELGRLADGRVYFTMAEVQGRNFTEVIRSVHAASPRRWEETEDGWSFARLARAFVQICDAVAYAHGRGVVHRDLKPANVMVGEHGEVLVVDWGLAKVVGSAPGRVDGVTTDRSQASAHQTLAGRIAGTPAYMPPEQAVGDVRAVDARTDVYALGAVLYELLAGRVPYRGASALAVLDQVLAGPPAPLGDHAQRLEAGLGPRLPHALVELVESAMSRQPGDRPADAADLADAVRSWLDGVQKRKDALALVRAAEAKAPAAAGLRAEAAALRVRAEAALADVPG